MKLPAYGAQLLRARRAGQHPAMVAVIYGNDWQFEDGITRLAVKPGDALGRDWRCVAGVKVDLLFRGGEADFDEFLALAGGIARDAGLVTLCTPWPLYQGSASCRADLGTYAFCCRHVMNRRVHWPAWWNEELDKINGRNRNQWIREVEAYVAQVAA